MSPSKTATLDDRDVAPLKRSLRRDAKENHDRVLAAAHKVFDEYGPDAGIAEVARVAGVGPGTIYRRFATKEALIDAVVQDAMNSIIAMANEALALPDGKGLEHFLFATGTYNAERPGCVSRIWKTEHESKLVARKLISKLLIDAKRHRRVRDEITNTDVTLVLHSLRGIVETTGAKAPNAWRRHLELLIAGMRPSDEAFVHRPLSQSDLDAALTRDADAS